jgi:hypothetical protein
LYHHNKYITVIQIPTPTTINMLMEIKSSLKSRSLLHFANASRNTKNARAVTIGIMYIQRANCRR